MLVMPGVARSASVRDEGPLSGRRCDGVAGNEHLRVSERRVKPLRELVIDEG